MPDGGPVLPKAPTAVDLFHAHLDACARCRHRCFDLCREGEVLLREAADEALSVAVDSLRGRQLRDPSDG